MKTLDRTTRSIRLVAGVLLGGAMAATALFGIGKLVDLPMFLAALRGWRVLPSSMIPVLVVLVASIACLVEGRSGSPPNCGCAGVLSAYVPWVDDPANVTLRNAVLGAALLVGLALRHAANRRPGPNPPQRSASQVAVSQGVIGRHGFSLIETLLVIAILALLAALVAPSLAGARNRSQHAASLGNLRTHTGVFDHYAKDFRDIYPYLTNPIATTSVVRCESRGIGVEVAYFDVWQYWHIGLADQYYDGNPFSAVFIAPDHPRGVLGTSYLYPLTFIARPEFWNLETRRAPPVQFHPTTNADVTFPSQKVLSFENLPYRLSRSVRGAPAGFVDGHGVILQPESITPRGPHEGEASWPRWSSLPGHWSFPLFYTLDGVRGRDVR